MQNFQNDLQMLGMDHYQVGEVIPLGPQGYQFPEDPRRCGRCGGGMRCGGMRCGGMRCGGMRCGGMRCGGFGRCFGGFGLGLGLGLAAGACGGCGGCYSCYSCYYGDNYYGYNGYY